MRMFKISFLSNCQIRSTVLTTVTVPYKTFPFLFPSSKLLWSKFCLLIQTPFRCHLWLSCWLPQMDMPSDSGTYWIWGFFCLFCLAGTDSIPLAGVLSIRKPPGSTLRTRSTVCLLRGTQPGTEDAGELPVSQYVYLSCFLFSWYHSLEEHKLSAIV